MLGADEDGRWCHVSPPFRGRLIHARRHPYTIRGRYLRRHSGAAELQRHVHSPGGHHNSRSAAADRMQQFNRKGDSGSGGADSLFSIFRESGPTWAISTWNPGPRGNRLQLSFAAALQIDYKRSSVTECDERTRRSGAPQRRDRAHPVAATSCARATINCRISATVSHVSAGTPPNEKSSLARNVYDAFSCSCFSHGGSGGGAAWEAGRRAMHMRCI